MTKPMWMSDMLDDEQMIDSQSSANYEHSIAGVEDNMSHQTDNDDDDDLDDQYDNRTSKI